MESFVFYLLSFSVFSTVSLILIICCGKRKNKPTSPPDHETGGPQENLPETIEQRTPEQEFHDNPRTPLEEKSMSPTEIESFRLQTYKQTNGGHRQMSYTKNAQFGRDAFEEEMPSLRLTSIREEKGDFIMSARSKKSLVSAFSPKDVSMKNRNVPAVKNISSPVLSLPSPSPSTDEIMKKCSITASSSSFSVKVAKALPKPPPPPVSISPVSSKREEIVLPTKIIHKRVNV